ncbi:xanthine dehydrogenase family protein molybdopterin-binding subunit [Pseudemcibacter aquimaris]|uniref:xanthine dehydrogenase family protein molybdopterin-binding subunit n=1 Tax=Pseudemcibacter aquimaris TaxID=2857064 RepID=UPI002011F492|nr:molybdopterin cofactor-binding domain-containing protein [Pseudemcibacter aquimaris]MCC3862117.1 molybdopterin-dependent oxidoreductase [Pseudemcibacter aquimaris]WDU58870.1 molybdopterin-dependent oxidoreductase [Pseudemcibacter aquimaris]
MGKIATITRRTFLVGSAAIAGGIGFGYYSYQKPIKNPLLDTLGDGEGAITPYVLINQDGVTLITPRADLGQGAYSIQAALLAEELDVDLNEINVDPGMPNGGVYYNTAVGAEAVGFPSTDESFLATKARLLGPVIGKLMGLQITGGSSTVPDCYEKLRVAGALARETLKTAAAMKHGVAIGTLKTENGNVILPDGKKIPYSDLALEATKIALPESVVLRPERDWKYIGKDMTRVDIPAKSTGTQEFGIDVKMDGMVYATVKTNPRIGGSLSGFDATNAREMNGVIDIVPVTGGFGVIADNTWRAFQAANAVEAEWGPAPYPAEQEEIWKQVSDSFTEERQDSRKRDDGDVELSFATGGLVTAEYKVPYLAHAPLEPMNATVKYGGGKLEIWTGTQIPTFMMANIERIYGISQQNIFVYALYSGGSFGRRLEDDYVHQAVELAIRHQNVPIKMTWMREEDMTHDFPRTIGMARGRGKINNGRVETFDLSIAHTSTIESSMQRMGQSVPGPDQSIVDGAWDQPFDIPNYRVTGYRAPVMVPVSSWRSVGASGNGFMHDCFLDELIHEAGADPMEERIRLCWHDASRKVLETVRDMSGWGTELGENRGRGVAFTLSFGVATAEVVEVTNTPDGIRIDKVYIALEVGKVLDPVNFDNQVKGGIVWGLGHAMNCELTYSDGKPEQDNFHAFQGMNMAQCPEIIVKGLENGNTVRGVGEPSVPPAGPALANAIFAATGKRIRELPLNKHIDFV